MAEYIDKEALFAEFDRLGLGENSFVEKIFSDGVRTIIACMPAADVAPVVRCKECKHWKPSGSKAVNSFSDMEYIGGCEFTNYCRRESDFCSYGERKEGAE